MIVNRVSRVSKAVRTRFAPSPTGLLHVGGTRTALFSMLLARASKGDFILRIEDTDRERSTKEFEEALIDDLKWLGIDFDEGPHIDNKAAAGPYRQSEREVVYDAYVEKLIKAGRAYPCYCSKERLARLRAAQLKAGLPPRYDNRCRNLKGEIYDIPAPAVRFMVDEEEVVRFTDLARGVVEQKTTGIGDFVIYSATTGVQYNLAATIDDALMNITHVVRGDDHLPNTPRHVMILKALGMEAPRYLHLPLVMAPGGKPLSKRDESLSIKALREEGFRPLALLNAGARLGWAPGEGLLTIDEMAERFDAKKLSLSPSTFDMERALRFNKQAISTADTSELAAMLEGDFKEGSRLREAVEVTKDTAATIKELKGLVRGLLTGEVNDEACELLKNVDAERAIRATTEALKGDTELTEEGWKDVLKEASHITASSGSLLKGKALFMPIRAAITGSLSGIELTRAATFIGRDALISRLKKNLCE